MLDIDNYILKTDPAKHKLAGRMQTLARKYKWQYEENPAPPGLTVSESDVARYRALYGPKKKYNYNRINNVTVSVPDKATVTCEICNEVKSIQDFVLYYLSRSRNSWLGWCRSCRADGRLPR